MLGNANLPDESDTLCEGCGYVLAGLPGSARCPECGKPIAESQASLRRPPSWEVAGPGRLRAFVRATIDCIFRPSRFFRSLSVRPASAASRRFARLHWGAAATLFGIAGLAHANAMGGVYLVGDSKYLDMLIYWLSAPAIVLLTYLFLFGLNSIAARLTTFEATLRGIRLPLPVVLRVLHYHAAHYLPVGLVAAATVIGFRALLSRAPNFAVGMEIPYLYVLCGEVIIAAGYLFSTYWIAMRTTMYGNSEDAKPTPHEIAGPATKSGG